MSNLKRLVSGALFGGALLTLGSLTVPSRATAAVDESETIGFAGNWTVSCDGNYCCTVNQSTGARGDCWYK